MNYIKLLADSKTLGKAKAVKTKKCKECGNAFQPFNSLQVACSAACAVLLARKKNEKRAWQKEKRERKNRLKSHAEWLAELQTVFNAYIRARDYGLPCVSCGTTAKVQYAAGHFFSVGAFPNVRFDEDNVHLQCNKKCNSELSGNIHNYRPALIEKIGIERFEALELRARSGKSGKMSIPEIQEKIRYYRKAARDARIKNSRGGSRY